MKHVFLSRCTVCRYLIVCLMYTPKDIYNKRERKEIEIRNTFLSFESPIVAEGPQEAITEPRNQMPPSGDEFG